MIIAYRNQLQYVNYYKLIKYSAAMLSQNIFRRREAQKKKIRREWLTSYFCSVRQQFMIENHALNQQLCQCISQLPESLGNLLNFLRNNQKEVINYILRNFQKFKQHLLDKKMSLKQWISYNFICENLILNWNENQVRPEIIRVIFHSIAGRGIVLCQKQKIVKKTILKDIIKMISLIQNGLIYLEHLDVVLLAQILKQNISLLDIQNENDDESFQDTVLVMSMMLTANQCKEKQNLDQKKLSYYAWLKNQFINQTLFQDIRILKRLIKTIFIAKKEILQTLLSFFVNMTYFQKSQSHFQILCQYQIYIVILHVLANETDDYILTLGIRLANNVINSCHQTAVKAQQSAIVTVLIEHASRGKFIKIQNEIYELIGNYIQENIKYEECLVYIQNKQLHIVLVNWLTEAQKYEVQTTIKLLEALLKIMQVKEQIIIYELIKNERILQQLYQSQNLDVEHYCDIFLQRIKQFKNKTHDHLF